MKKFYIHILRLISHSPQKKLEQFTSRIVHIVHPFYFPYKKSHNFYYFLTREARRCEFHVHASSGATPTLAPVTGGPPTVTEDSIRGRRGRLLSPRHTLPPNTTCQWTFHGRPGTCKHISPL